MSFLHALGDVGVFAGKNVALPVAVAWITAKTAATGSIRAQVVRTDRVVADPTRTCADGCDRDQAADMRMTEITERANEMGVIHGGALGAGRGKVYRIVLHEYRDEASRKLRALDDLLAGEGRWQRWYRRRTGRPTPTLELDDEGRAILAKWREAAEEDPSRPEIEPRLMALEAA